MKPKALPPVVSEKAFRAAIAKFRKKEKKHTRAMDKLNAQRRQLPMMEMPENYTFETPEGPKTFLDLFEGRKQLIVYHFMYHPEKDSFCKGCSFMMDQIAHPAHINERNTSFVINSEAPLKSIQRHKKKMGWKLPWVSSWNNKLNDDLEIDGNVHHEMSVFVRDGKRIFRTYFTNERGVEYVGSPWSLLDLTPWGRQEKWEKSPKGVPQTDPYIWWKYHDEYK